MTLEERLLEAVRDGVRDAVVDLVQCSDLGPAIVEQMAAAAGKAMLEKIDFKMKDKASERTN